MTQYAVFQANIFQHNVFQTEGVIVVEGGVRAGDPHRVLGPIHSSALGGLQSDFGSLGRASLGSLSSGLGTLQRGKMGGLE